MNEIKPITTGIAYHSNRILKSVREDMLDCVNHSIDLVVHMFSHNDLDRHRLVMKDIISATEDLGLDVWIDNWGLGGPPGDKSHFLAYHPEAHQILNDGSMDPVSACYNQPSFLDFTKTWMDAVRTAGGKNLFWDEPHLKGYFDESGNMSRFSCCCDVCKKLFEEKYNKPMPMVITDEVLEFRADSIAKYLEIVTAYAENLGMKNAVCVMLGKSHGVNLENLAKLCAIPSLHNVGSDPYWLGQNLKNGAEVYDFVYKRTKRNLDLCYEYKKDHNLWIQAYNFPKGREEEIINATDAAYDAGARTIIAWGFRGGESNDYRSQCCDRTWHCVGEAMRRIKTRHNDKIRNFALENLRKENAL